MRVCHSDAYGLMLPGYQVNWVVKSTAGSDGRMAHPVTLGRNLGAAADTMAIKGSSQNSDRKVR